MIRRRWIAGCLAVVLLVALLPGCKPSKDNGEATTTAPVLPTAPKEEPKDVAFTCQNYDFDLFTYYAYTPLSFYILTREYVDVTDIAVTIPVEQGYDVFVFDDSTMNDYYQLTEIMKGTDGTLYAFESDHEYLPWLYQTGRGMDWKDLGEKRLRWQQASDQHEKLRDEGLLNTPEGEKAMKELTVASEEYADANDTFLDEYGRLKPADLPTFYMYRVEIFFQSGPDLENSSFREIQVDIAGESYTVPIGEIRLRNEMLSDAYSSALEMVSSAPFMMSSEPYAPGIKKCQGETLIARKDVTLLGCELADSDSSTVQIQQIQLVLSDENGTMDLIWDGKTPLQIPRGKQITFHFVVRDERLQEMCYGGSFTPMVTYGYEDQTYARVMSVDMQIVHLAPWMWYEACLQGLDLESYFTDYYYYAVDTAWKQYQ